MAHNLKCSVCGKSFSLKRNLVKHNKKFHGGQWRCVNCDKTFERYDNYCFHERNCEFRLHGKRIAVDQIGGGSSKRQRVNILDSESHALDHATDRFTVHLQELNQTPETIIDILRDSIMNLKPTIEVELERKRALKIIVALHVTFHQATDPTFLSEPPPVFKSMPVEILEGTDIDEGLNIITNQLMKKIDDFEERGSGWVLHELSRLDLNTYIYDPLRASTYIPLPKDLKAKHAVVNIQNQVGKILIVYKYQECFHCVKSCHLLITAEPLFFLLI